MGLNRHARLALGFGLALLVALFLYRPAYLFDPLRTMLQHTILTKGFVFAVGLTLLLERLIPVEPSSPIFGRHLAQDLVWFVYERVLHAAVIVTWVAALRALYDAHFSAFTIHTVNQWPEWSRLAVGIVLLDFLYWLQHWLNHKVPWLWQLHAVHHSQERINFFSDYRYHTVEYIVRQTVITIPFLVLRVSIPTIFLVSLFLHWYTRFYHGNIRTNLGPLRYLLVTPQSHRVHHSRETRHRDTNYGSIFSIWDRVLGTQYPGSREYPATGINNPDFPRDRGLLQSPFVQMAYPFGKLTSRRSDPGSAP